MQGYGYGVVRCGAARFEGDGAVAFDGAAIRVLDAAGAAAGTVAGGLPGTVTLDLATALFSMYYTTVRLCDTAVVDLQLYPDINTCSVTYSCMHVNITIDF